MFGATVTVLMGPVEQRCPRCLFPTQTKPTTWAKLLYCEPCKDYYRNRAELRRLGYSESEIEKRWPN